MGFRRSAHHLKATLSAEMPFNHFSRIYFCNTDGLEPVKLVSEIAN
jgi:hypothetical protein